MKLLTGLLLWGVMLPVQAAARAGESAVQPLSLGNVFSMLFGLALVLGLLLGGAWLLKRMQDVRTRQVGSDNQIKLVAAQSLGLKDRVLLLRIGEEFVLVGSSNQGLNRLHSWRAGTLDDSFAGALQQARGQARPGPL